MEDKNWRTWVELIIYSIVIVAVMLVLKYLLPDSDDFIPG